MSGQGLSYKDSGVDIASGDEATERIKQLVKKTYNPAVLNGIGGFGGLFDGRFKGLKQPVLVSSADGVGTKLKLAFLTGKHDTVGQDLVNHCTNDILVMGARPLFFLDYFATGKLVPAVVADVVAGMARACKENGCALIGGETAEMPGFYQENEYDLAGFIVGVVERSRIVDGSKIRPGDLVLGLESSGLHTNGYSLARRLFFDKLNLAPDSPIPGLGQTVAEALMAVHRSYLKPITKLREQVAVHGLAHITGGGIPGNLVRVLPKNCRAVIAKSAWAVPPLFRFMQEQGDIAESDLYSAFNMGIGLMLVISAKDRDAALRSLKRQKVACHVVGEIVRGKREVSLQ
ncbi:MAG: phosphoribosylformylglycinamidine cyclo-ligase [candidate division Zixibacteria bacterium]|nr:phosphoribosylformylglycinamidine cyclo-ligase [candidate division Zixibacteria bacterium]